uniref:Uncharacterized protein n=1 Tax=Capra hircus TaxID=9925 RepID=A0A8C2P3L0_CAPHI
MAGEAPLPAHPPRDCCKIPTASWQMPKACSTARRGQLLMRSLIRGAGCQAPAPAGFSLAPSEPVSAGPQHLGRGAQRPGEARPHPKHSAGVLHRILFPAEPEGPGPGEARVPTGPGFHLLACSSHLGCF